MAKRGRQASKEEIEEGSCFCPGCDKVRPLTAFGKDSTRPRGVQLYCKPCRKERKNAWRLAAVKRKNEAGPTYRGLNLKEKYGISLSEYQAMSEEQGHVCAICGNPEAGEKPLAVDHDHKSGALRGLLCFRCNAGIGRFDDSSKILASAAAYLKASGC